jgi:hypothetical protein
MPLAPAIIKRGFSKANKTKPNIKKQNQKTKVNKKKN